MDVVHVLQAPNQPPTITIDSVELATRGGQVQNLNTARFRQGQGQAQALTVNIQSILKKPTNNITKKGGNKLVTFKDEEQKEDNRNKQSRKRNEDMVIEFQCEDEDNELSGLSHSIGQDWDDEEEELDFSQGEHMHEKTGQGDII